MKGSPHLHRGPALLGILGEGLRRHGGAVDTVASGLGTHVHYRVAAALGLAGEDPVPLHQPQRERVHQNVGVVALVEGDLSAYGGHTDAVAVAADAAYHPVYQVRGLGVPDATEPE